MAMTKEEAEIIIDDIQTIQLSLENSLNGMKSKIQACVNDTEESKKRE